MANYDWRTGDQVKAGKTGFAWTTAILVFIAVVSIASGVFYYAVWQPFTINRENANIRNSIGYTQRANEQCIGDIAKYNDPAASSGQKAAAVNDCRIALSGVPENAVDPSVAQFLASR